MLNRLFCRTRTSRFQKLNRKRTSGRFRPRFETLEPRDLLAVITVDSNADTVNAGDNVTTLREAILQANASSGADTIEFNLPSGSTTITLAAANGPLPAISESLTIDGGTQPGFAGAPIVAIDADAISSASALRVYAADSHVRHVEVASSSRFGVELRTGTNTPPSVSPVTYVGEDRILAGDLEETATVYNVHVSPTAANGTGFSVYLAANVVVARSSTTGHYRGAELGLGAEQNWFVENDFSGATNVGVYAGTTDAGGNRFIGNDVSNSFNGFAINYRQGGNVYRENDASGTAIGIMSRNSSGNHFQDNDVSETTQYGLFINGDPDFQIIGNNFDNAGQGRSAIRIEQADGFTIDPTDNFQDVDLSNAPAGALWVVDANNVTITGIDLSWAGPTRSGNGLSLSVGSGNVVSNIRVANRSTGVTMNVAQNYLVSCSEFLNNGTAVYVPRSDNSNLTFSDNHFADNLLAFYNLSSATDPTINAANNYWGAGDGPGNLGGSGDSYSGDVLATPFLSTVPECAGTIDVIQPVDLDVTPGAEANKVNVKSQGRIAVAVYTTNDFAATSIEAGTVQLGGIHADHFATEDVDGDGDLDLVLHFRTQDLIDALAINLNSGDSETVDVRLTGETVDELLIEGFDTIEFFRPGKGRGRR